MGAVTILSCPITIGGSKPFYDSAASNTASAHLENSDAARTLDNNKASPWSQTFFAFQLSP